MSDTVQPMIPTATSVPDSPPGTSKSKKSNTCMYVLIGLAIFLVIAVVVVLACIPLYLRKNTTETATVTTNAEFKNLANLRLSNSRRSESNKYLIRTKREVLSYPNGSNRTVDTTALLSDMRKFFIDEGAREANVSWTESSTNPGEYVMNAVATFVTEVEESSSNTGTATTSTNIIERVKSNFVAKAASNSLTSNPPDGFTAVTNVSAITSTFTEVLESGGTTSAASTTTTTTTLSVTSSDTTNSTLADSSSNATSTINDSSSNQTSVIEDSSRNDTSSEEGSSSNATSAEGDSSRNDTSSEEGSSSNNTSVVDDSSSNNTTTSSNSDVASTEQEALSNVTTTESIATNVTTTESVATNVTTT